MICVFGKTQIKKNLIVASLIVDKKQLEVAILTFHVHDCLWCVSEFMSPPCACGCRLKDASVGHFRKDCRRRITAAGGVCKPNVRSASAKRRDIKALNPLRLSDCLNKHASCTARPFEFTSSWVNVLIKLRRKRVKNYHVCRWHRKSHSTLSGLHFELLGMMVSTKITTPLKSTMSRNYGVSVSCGANSQWDFAWVRGGGGGSPWRGKPAGFSLTPTPECCRAPPKVPNPRTPFSPCFRAHRFEFRMQSNEITKLFPLLCTTTYTHTPTPAHLSHICCT